MTAPPSPADARRRLPRGGVLLRLRAARVVQAGGLVAFLGGFLIAPCLHTAAHRPDHIHRADGSTAFHGRAARAWLYQAAHAHSHPHPQRGPGTGGPLPGHGRHAAAHFGLAVPPGTLFILPPPPRAAQAAPAPRPPATIAARRPGGLPEARGPPLSSIRVV
jgi:hypothetical protein